MGEIADALRRARSQRPVGPEGGLRSLPTAPAAVSRAAGLEEVLLGRSTLDDVRVSVQSPAIDVFPVVTPQDAAHELLVLPQLAAMIADLERRYATVVVDTPPSPLVPDAMLILRHVAA